MKFTNVKKTVLTGVVMGAALFTFNFTALPGSVNLPAVVQAAEANFTGEEAGKLYLAGKLYTGVALKDGKFYNYKEGVQGVAYTGIFTGKYLKVQVHRRRLTVYIIRTEVYFLVLQAESIM